MKVRCDYCRQMIDDGLEACPHCGASLPITNRVAHEQPKTIEELKKWYVDHKLPPEEVTRFFIGKDIKEPKAFGIYKSDGGDFVVYKNKANGERAVRYQGSDEGYAVNELYQRLKAEIADQKEHNAKKRTGKKRVRHSGFHAVFIITAIVILTLFASSLLDHAPSRGYYRYRGNDYYYQGSSWYVYNALTDDWDYADNGDELDEIITDDNDSEYRTYIHDGTAFEDTTWYDSGSSDDTWDWDSDSTWDSDDTWDSDWGSDWDSDW